MTNAIDALTARTRFGEVLEKAGRNNTRFLVSKRGKPKVVILGVEDYLKNVVKQSKLLTEVQLSAEKNSLNGMTNKEINAEISAYRKSVRKTRK